MNSTRIPRYRELLERTDAPAGSSWGVFGQDDELGTVNFITPERVAAAASRIRTGRMFNLDCPVNAFSPPLSPQRKPAVHSIFAPSHDHRDDYIDSFYMQSSSQIDSLRHIRHPIHGFYNGASAERIVPGDSCLGINRWADHGIAGRGVLLDVARHARLQGRPLDQRTNDPISAALLEEVARDQGVSLQPGDILLVRTGWLHYYFNEATEEERNRMPRQKATPGLLQSHETLEWLWDNQVSVCAADNPGVEAVPAHASSPFMEEHAHSHGEVNPRHRGLMHPRLIAMLGLVLGELWNFEALAEDCAQDGTWDFFVTVKPLNLVGGVGSPCNALAIK